jgi:hypothetical protein
VGEQRLDLLEFSLAGSVGLVDHEHVGELDLVDQELCDAPLVAFCRCEVAIGEAVPSTELAQDRRRVDDGDGGVELGDVAEARAVLAAVGERGRDGHRLADAGRLDDQMVEPTLGGQPRDLDDEVFAQRAADAAVRHLDELLVRAHHVGTAEQHRVDVDLAHVVDDHGDPQVLAVGEDVSQQAGLPRSQKPGEHRDRQLAGAVLIHR